MSAARETSLGRDAAIVGAAVLATLVLPAVVYGVLSWYRFDYFRLTYYVPFEEFGAALAEPTWAGLFAAPLMQMNMTSGHLLSNMYAVTLGQLLLSLGLGAAIGLLLVSHLRLRGACGTRAAAGAGAGLLATVAASSTGLLGCCGSALAGGVLALAGISSAAAAQVAGVSPLIQGALIVLFAGQAALLWRRRRRIERGGGARAGRLAAAHGR